MPLPNAPKQPPSFRPEGQQFPTRSRRYCVIRICKRLPRMGMSVGQRASGYRRRSLVQTIMYRYKTIIGLRFHARTHRPQPHDPPRYFRSFSGANKTSGKGRISAGRLLMHQRRDHPPLQVDSKPVNRDLGEITTRIRVCGSCSCSLSDPASLPAVVDQLTSLAAYDILLAGEAASPRQPALHRARLHLIH
jgi:hypothetical protein